VKSVASERSVIVLSRAGSCEFTSANEGEEVKVTSDEGKGMRNLAPQRGSLDGGLT